MSNTILADVLFYNMRTVIENDGSLVPIESNYDIPFPIKRIFYVYGIGRERFKRELNQKRRVFRHYSL